MTVTIPLVILAGILVYFAHRYLGMRLWHAFLAIAFGFLLAATGFAPGIHGFLHGVAHWLNALMKGR
jgi:hypothetical protein